MTIVMLGDRYIDLGLYETNKDLPSINLLSIVPSDSTTCLGTTSYCHLNIPRKKLVVKLFMSSLGQVR